MLRLMLRLMLCLVLCLLPQVYQSVVAQLGADHPGHIEAVVALADLHRELGQQADAER